MTELRQPPPGAEKRVLYDVLSVGRVTEEVTGEGEQWTAVTPDQDGKRVIVPFGSPYREHTVGDR
jgi:hypothetical protein